MSSTGTTSSDSIIMTAAACPSDVPGATDEPAGTNLSLMGTLSKAAPHLADSVRRGGRERQPQQYLSRPTSPKNRSFSHRGSTEYGALAVRRIAVATVVRDDMAGNAAMIQCLTLEVPRSTLASGQATWRLFASTPP